MISKFVKVLSFHVQVCDIVARYVNFMALMPNEITYGNSTTI